MDLFTYRTNQKHISIYFVDYGRLTKLLGMCMIHGYPSFSGVFVLMIAVPVVATERASAKFVFTHFNTDNSAGIHSHLYIFVLGLLMSQYTLSGYDASAHMVQKSPQVT